MRITQQIGAEELRIVYEELRSLARVLLRGERRAPHTLQPTALVHEALLRLNGGCPVQIRDTRHFFALGCQTMRRVLVEHARRRLARRYGGGLQRVLADWESLAVPDDRDMAKSVLIGELIDKLKNVDERLGCLAELRYFLGFTEEEAAAILGLSLSTVKRDGAVAQHLLYEHLTGNKRRKPSRGR